MNGNTVEVSYKKADFDGLKLQLRKSGDEIWRFADETTESNVKLRRMPPDAPRKFEFSGV